MVKLSKSGLGAAATPASVLCTVYAELSCKASSKVESAYWCKEAAALLPKVRAAADAALAALAPPPPAPAGEEEAQGEGEEEPEKKKEDPAEVAAKVRRRAGKPKTVLGSVTRSLEHSV